MSITFEPPQGQDRAPKRASAGGSRESGRCFHSGNETGRSIVPLTPQTNHGLTLAERPTFFAYVPKTKETQEVEAFFIIEDKDQNPHYFTSVSLSSVSGVVSIPLPQEAPALEIGRDYKWTLAIGCSGDLDPNSPFVEAWIKRVEPNSLSGSQETSLERAESLGADGIWYDAVEVLVELREQYPEDARLGKEWAELLDSAGLQEIATEPLLSR
ncbi:MAG: DUF928 domain-containing protein [Oscillatoria sp. SIO1A7]|nr:DUF928 domain-containing protein [Oscillatoria sp. SIO1A7]